MAGIEQGACDLVVNLANNVRVELSASDKQAITAWVAAAGVVAGKLGVGPDFVSEDAAHMRTQNALPEGFKAWIIYGDERRDDIFSQHRSGLTRHGASWLAWFWIGRTIFLVASEGAARLLDARLEGISLVVQQLHPSIAGPSKWPPPEASFTGGITPAHMHAIGSL
ncbi:hypothetical protein ACIQTW_13150 [Paenarthrobacter sp. NPDC090517]|uniref:hypothetical protein n=1 Tax=Paenarthrobacter sp. NPDC090517 TaxID=3364381 RepID=UPI00380F0C2F